MANSKKQSSDTLSEDQLKEKVGVTDWHEVDAPGFLRFAAEMPKMDRDVALQVVRQFPHFKALARESLDSLDKGVQGVLDTGWKSQKKVHESFRRYQQLLEREIERADDPESRMRIIGLFNEAIDKEIKLNTEHKSFALKVLGVAGTAAVIVVGAGIVALGGKASFGQKN